MVRGERIKEYVFPAQTFSGAGQDATIYTDHVINGEILNVSWSHDGTGSLWLTISGTAEEFFRRNAPSGTGYQVSVPYKFSESTTGSIANANHIPFIVNDKVVFNVLNSSSGTLAFNLTLRYR